MKARAKKLSKRRFPVEDLIEGGGIDTRDRALSIDGESTVEPPVLEILAPVRRVQRAETKSVGAMELPNVGDGKTRGSYGLESQVAQLRAEISELRGLVRRHGAERNL